MDTRRNRLRSKTAFPVIVLVSILVASVPIEADTKAPDFTITDIDGNAFTLSDHRGKVVLIDFFATSYASCMETRNILKEVRNTFPEDELAIISISVSVSDNEDDVRNYKNQHGGNWTYALDSQNLASSYEVASIPREFIIDMKGYVRYIDMDPTSAGVLSDKIEEAGAGYARSEILFALIAIVAGIVVAVISGTVVALLWKNRQH